MILSGLLLRNNLNCRGDYFHKTFQPFTFKPIADQSSLNSLIVDSYQTATEKLLKYQENSSRLKTKPFISYKTVYKQQQQLFTQIDQLLELKQNRFQLIFLLKNNRNLKHQFIRIEIFPLETIYPYLMGILRLFQV